MTPRSDLLALSVDEKLDLIEQLWDSLGEREQNALAVPQWHRDILDRRLEDMQRDPAASIPWEQVKSRLLPKK